MKIIFSALIVLSLLSCKKYDKVIENCEVKTYLEVVKPTCLIKDEINNIWIGTKNGIYCCDAEGIIWKNYNVGNSKLISNDINDITYGENGLINIFYDRTYCNDTLGNWPFWAYHMMDKCYAPISILEKGVISDEIKTHFNYIYCSEENTRFVLIGTPSGLYVFNKNSQKFKLYNKNNSDLPENEIFNIKQIDEFYYILLAGNDYLSYLNLQGGFSVKNFKNPCYNIGRGKQILLGQTELENTIKECNGKNNCDKCSELIGVDDKSGTWYRRGDGLVREEGEKRTLFKTDKIMDNVFENILYFDNKVWFQSSDRIILLKYTD